LYLGIAAATAQVKAMAWMSGGIFAAICLLLGKNVWVLIPATLSMKGGLNLLPGQIPPWVFMTMVVGGLFLMRVALRKQSITIRWTWIETAVLLVGLTIFQAMLRNPVGLQSLGGATAGGRPYFIFAFAASAYYLIVVSRPDAKSWRLAAILYIILGVCDGLIQAASALSPGFGMMMIRIYSNVSVEEATISGSGYDLDETRLAFLAQIGAILCMIACSFWRPLATLDIRKPWRALIGGIGIVCILLSGFRGALAGVFTRFALGSFIRGKGLDLLFVVFASSLVVIVIAMGDLGTKLPFGVQRILSSVPIPMNLNYQAVRSAEGSSEDRFEMWEIVLRSDRFIQNKVLGDGFQFSAVEIKAMSEVRVPGSPISQMSWMDRSLEVGNYHGFHVETIRFTGVLGLLAATFALLVFAVYAWKAIKLHRGNELWGYVIFICMPVVINPFWYWLVFGSYRSGYPELIAMAGMVKAIYQIGLSRSVVSEQNAPDHREQTTRKTAASPG